MIRVLASETHTILEALKIGGPTGAFFMVIAFFAGYASEEKESEKGSTGLTWAALTGLGVILLVAGGYLVT